jgi:hypothetical protein
MIGEPIEGQIRRASTGWIAPVLRQPLLGEIQVTFWDRNIAGLIHDEVPQGLQVTNLLVLGKRGKPRWLGNRRMFHAQTSAQAYRTLAGGCAIVP